MTNVIAFPQKKKAILPEKVVSLMFCRDCLKQRICISDLSKRRKGSYTMLVPIIDQDNNSFYTYITIDIMDLKGILAANDTEQYVDLAKYATIQIISERSHSCKDTFL